MIPGNTSTPYRLIKKALSRFAQECKALILWNKYFVVSENNFFLENKRNVYIIIEFSSYLSFDIALLIRSYLANWLYQGVEKLRRRNIRYNYSWVLNKQKRIKGSRKALTFLLKKK